MSPSQVKIRMRPWLAVLSVCILSSQLMAQDDNTDQGPRRYRTRISQGRVLPDLDTQNPRKRATDPATTAGTDSKSDRKTSRATTTAKSKKSRSKKSSGWRLPDERDVSKKSSGSKGSKERSGRREANGRHEAPVVELVKTSGPDGGREARPARRNGGNARIAPLLLAQAAGADDPADRAADDADDADPGDAPGAAAPGAAAPGAAAPGAAAPGAAAPGGGAAPVGGAAPGDGDDFEVIEPDPGLGGQSVQITEGEIPLRDFLKFLADHTQRTVLTDSTDTKFLDRLIIILSKIENANYAIVKAILETNKVRVFREELPDGTEIIKAEPMTAQSANTDPKDVPVLEIGVHGDTRDPRTGEVTKVGDDEFATIVFTLKHVPPDDAIEALKALVGGQAAGGKGARGGASTFSMVEIKNTQTLIVTAKFGLLSYLKTLLQLIDVPFEEPERIIQILQVEWADAQELSSVIEQFLQGRGGSRFGRGGQRSVTGGAGASRKAAGGSRTGGASGRNSEFRTNIIPDSRTNKLLIETFSEQDVRDIEMLVNELDVRFEQRRLRTHIYQVRYLKADEVSQDLQQLIQGGSGGGLGGRSSGGRSSRLRGGVPRVGRRGRTGGAAGGAAGQNQGAPQNVELPALIVPHIPTNSLLIQAEIEDYDEILNILNEIDTKRRQVFLEAALVQVQSSSNLAFAIDLIAGQPDDRATRALGASNFTGLSTIDLQTFDRIIGADPTSPGSLPTGGFLALMKNGDFPFLLRFLKSNQDSQILATPFIVADDNEENSIEILETRYVQNTAVQNNQTTLSSQQGEAAGITLALTPTISGSQKAVFMTLDLSVSEFQEAAAGNTLPPKNENTLTSSVTIPDGQIFVVGGLTRENNSKSVSKVPILGDIPILGKLFRDEVTVRSQNNLYVFLQAHVLTDEDFKDAIELTNEAQEQMQDFSDTVKNPVRFERPEASKHRAEESDSDDDRRFFDLNPSNNSKHFDPYDDAKQRADQRRRDRNDLDNNRRTNLRRDPNAPTSQVPSSHRDEDPARRPSDNDLDDRRRRGGLGYDDPQPDSGFADPQPDSTEKSSKGGSGWFDLK